MGEMTYEGMVPDSEAGIDPKLKPVVDQVIADMRANAGKRMSSCVATTAANRKEARCDAGKVRTQIYKRLGPDGGDIGPIKVSILEPESNKFKLLIQRAQAKSKPKGNTASTKASTKASSKKPASSAGKPTASEVLEQIDAAAALGGGDIDTLPPAQAIKLLGERNKTALQ
jgi:hypothetical protein